MAPKREAQVTTTLSSHRLLRASTRHTKIILTSRIYRTARTVLLAIEFDLPRLEPEDRR